MIDSHFDNYRKELKEKNLNSVEDLESLVKPIIKAATKIEVQSSSRPPENSQMQSHFGGQPYFEQGEEWEQSKNGKAMDFIFQIFNNDEIVLPQNIKLSK